jgi:hypothetical protein
MFRHNGADSIGGFLARPKAEGVYPAVLVIAGNKITEEYIPNTCAALAVAESLSSPDEMRSEHDPARSVGVACSKPQGGANPWSKHRLRVTSLEGVQFCL